MSAQERDDLRERIRREEDGMPSHPGELADLQDAVGEDIDEAIDESVSDTDEPIESQKRELLKIYRNLGHPAPRELARAFKHAGAKRHLIRGALIELRCPICESRVRPNTRRPGVLPRSMKFNLKRLGAICSSLMNSDTVPYS